MAAGKPPFIYENEEKSHGRKKRYSLYRNRSHPYAPGESKKGSRRFDGAGRIDEKQGCLQNLTVVPVEEQPGEYYALIGNRRHGASKLAGLEELPCRIAEGLSRKEQLSIMLEENMQRSDLTIYEQAQGFQLMLDLGDTEEQIAEKTGFSKDYHSP